MTSRRHKPGEPPVDGDFAWNAQELALLQAARLDRAPADLQQRMREGFECDIAQTLGSSPSLEQLAEKGASASLRPGQPAPAQGLRSSGLFGSKLALWGTLGLLALGGAAYLTVSSSRPSDHAAQARPPSATTGASAARAVATPPQARGERAESVDASQLTAAGQSQARGAGGEPVQVPQLTAVGQQQARDAGDGRVHGLRLTAAGGQSPVRTGAAGRVLGRGAAVEQQGPQGAAVRSSQLQPTVAGEARVDAAATAATDQLRVEAQLLDGARQALGRDALPQAGQLLDRYATQFAHGVLHPESDVLRIELQMRRGEPDAARAQASRFLSEYPNHPLRDRVRALTAAR